MRQIVLDTETTGLDIEEGHRILEIGCVEIVDRKLTRRHFHQYINPQREIDEGALQVHGITREFLKDKPAFSDVFDDFLEFVRGAELVIHNAEFDIGFIDHEMKQMPGKLGSITDHCQVIDSLDLARSRHPGQKNTLDALCKRYNVDNSGRDLHGALLDAELLADVYLLMTGGQVDLGLDEIESGPGEAAGIRRLPADRPALKVIRATDVEQVAHAATLQRLKEKSGGQSLWQRLEAAET